MYAVIRKDKILGIGSKQLCKQFRDERNNKVKIKKIPERYINNDKFYYIILRNFNIDNSEYISSDLVMTNSEHEQVPLLVEDFLIDFREAIDIARELIKCIKEKEYRMILEDCMENIDSRVFYGPYTSGSDDYLDNDINIYKLLNMCN